MMREAIRLAKQPDTKHVYMDTAVSKIFGDKRLGRKRPDLVRIRKDGKVDMFEIPSKSQTEKGQLSKLRTIRKKIDRQGDNEVISIRRSSEPKSEPINRPSPDTLPGVPPVVP
jgi:hypothetical protein